MFKKTVRGKNVRDGSADNAVFKRKVYFKKSVTKIAKFRNFENRKKSQLTSCFILNHRPPRNEHAPLVIYRY